MPYVVALVYRVGLLCKLQIDLLLYTLGCRIYDAFA